VGEFSRQPPRNLHPLPRSPQVSFSILRVANNPLLFSLAGADGTGSLNNALFFILLQRIMIFLPLIVLLLFRNVGAQVNLLPFAIPLAVRSPYLNCWLQNGSSVTEFAQTWPSTFNRTQVCHPSISCSCS
jgi:hypothetical protein